MKKILLYCLLITMLLLPISTITVSADSGPKPYVELNLEGLEGQQYYVTLLSESDTTGPWDTSREFYSTYGDHSAWDAFIAYKDSDGYYFLGCYENCSETNQFTWGYFPPQKFKVLIYFPQTKTFLTSANTYERYAFKSIFDATVRNGNIELKETPASLKEIPHFFARLLVTLLLELGIALTFAYCSKKQLLVITITNIATQVLLNLVLFNVVEDSSDWLPFYSYYVLLEIFIIIIEGFVYQLLLKRYSMFTPEKGRPWIYSLTANFASFLLGIILASWFPGVF